MDHYSISKSSSVFYYVPTVQRTRHQRAYGGHGGRQSAKHVHNKNLTLYRPFTYGLYTVNRSKCSRHVWDARRQNFPDLWPPDLGLDHAAARCVHRTCTASRTQAQPSPHARLPSRRASPSVIRHRIKPMNRTRTFDPKPRPARGRSRKNASVAYQNRITSTCATHGSYMPTCNGCQIGVQ